MKNQQLNRFLHIHSGCNETSAALAPAAGFGGRPAEKGAERRSAAMTEAEAAAENVTATTNGAAENAESGGESPGGLGVGILSFFLVSKNGHFGWPSNRSFGGRSEVVENPMVKMVMS